jgi:cytosine/adenosine deaminase-related metal-dependent hydrolase
VSKESGLILEIATFTTGDMERNECGATDALPAGVLENVVDLRHLTIFPGFVDAHVHSEPCI